MAALPPATYNVTQKWPSLHPVAGKRHISGERGAQTAEKWDTTEREAPLKHEALIKGPMLAGRPPMTHNALLGYVHFRFRELIMFSGSFLLIHYCYFYFYVLHMCKKFVVTFLVEK